MSYQVYKRINIDEDNDQRRDSLVYAAELYTNYCNDDNSKVLFCNSPRSYGVCHRL